MASITCPHCGEKTFGWRDKYFAGKWAVLHCSGCDGRVCAQPIVLAAIYFLYVWDVVLFGYLAYLDSLWYLLVMLVGWLILDYFSVYVPFSALRARGTKNNVQKTVAEPDSPSKDDLSKLSKDS